MHVHERWGTATAAGLVLWALLYSVFRTRRLAVLLGVVVALLILVTAYLGGVVAHGES